MNLMSNELFKAVRYALYAGATAAVGMSAAPVFAQDAAQDQNGQKLETITVTGSNIRRVDIETSNPVITVDRAAIQKSGKVTVGDLLQELPTVAGAANNPNVNNGGGTGGSFISLRGLGTNRTLILVNGKRVIDSDVNKIPASAIERIEILSDGASAVYGSDAIGGVVNFILRKDFQGAEISTSYGISDKDDGARKNFSLTFGQTTDKGSLVGGIDYNKTDQILGSHRDFSTFALTKLPNGAGVAQGGSFATPTGLVTAPVFAANCPAGSLGVGAGTYDPTAPGGNGIPAGYRCFMDSGNSTTQNDKYNYAAINLIETPQERTNFFLIGSYKLGDSAELYSSMTHNKTSSRSQLAALPLDLFASGITVDANQIYNPFGIPIGLADPANGAYGDLLTRLTALGPRIFSTTQTNDQAVVGLKGTVGDSSWTYDLWGNYGRTSVNTTANNFFNAAGAATALSASCVAPTAGVPLSTNTCLNIFNQNDPNTAALLKQFYALNVYSHSLSTERQAGLDVTGSLFELPAGTVSLATGVNYRKFNTESDADTVTLTDPLTSTCPAGSPSLCTSPFAGGFNVKEAYAELLVPILKDIPFIHSLNLTLGDRYSKYNTFGSTNNWKVGVEFRPIEDLLLRGTVSTVFRAPNTSELFAPLASSYDTYVSPGISSTGQNFASRNGDQVQVLFSGAAVAGTAIKPEIGKSFDFGIVYDPQWITGLSLSADLWRIYLNNLIVRVDGQTIANFCFNDPNSTYCSFINFTSNGISNISGVGVGNLGRLDTRGVDFAGTYKLPETPVGNFSVGLNATYLTQYDNTVPFSGVTHVAGTFNSQYGEFPRWRALGNLGWQLGDVSFNWTQRYLGRTELVVPSPEVLKIGAVVYHNISAGYNIQPLNTRIDVGVDNVADKQPPLFYQGVVNANIDINTYDPIGRFYWARATIKF